MYEVWINIRTPRGFKNLEILTGSDLEKLYYNTITFVRNCNGYRDQLIKAEFYDVNESQPLIFTIFCMNKCIALYRHRDEKLIFIR